MILIHRFISYRLILRQEPEQLHGICKENGLHAILAAKQGTTGLQRDVRGASPTLSGLVVPQQVVVPTEEPGSWPAAFVELPLGGAGLPHPRVGPPAAPAGLVPCPFFLSLLLLSLLLLL